MKYIWTEDAGAGLHYWQLVNHYLLGDEYIVESKQSNQGLLDAVRALDKEVNNNYYIAFDVIYDNMDIMNKYIDLQVIAGASNGKIKLIDITCFEYIILAFRDLIEWTGTKRKDKIEIRKAVLSAMKGHQIDFDQIYDERTMNYLKGFKRFSTERVMKSLVYELTDQRKWGIKGMYMGECWYKDCCIIQSEQQNCVMESMSGTEKIERLLHDTETLRLIRVFCKNDEG